MSYPNSNIFLLNEEIKLTNYKDTEHYQLTRSFLESPEMYFRHLFNDI
jgi:predicted ATPase